MSKRTFSALAAVLAAVALAVVLAPLAAADQKERVGARINLFAGGFQVFPADEPFHVQHGWGLDQEEPENPQALGRNDFTLSLDGVERRESFVDKFHAEHPEFGRLQWRMWVYNFPEGLTGTHTFTGHWTGPCQGLVNSGFAPGPCENPVELTTSVAPLTITVVFIP